MRHIKVSMLCVPIHVAMHFICSTGMAYGAISSSIGFAEAHILVPFGLATGTISCSIEVCVINGFSIGFAKVVISFYHDFGCY